MNYPLTNNSVNPIVGANKLSLDEDALGTILFLFQNRDLGRPDTISHVRLGAEFGEIEYG